MGGYVDRLLIAEGIRLAPDLRPAVLAAISDVSIQAASQLARNAAGDYAPDPSANRFPLWPPPALAAKPTVERPTKVSIRALFDGRKAEGQRTADDGSVRRWRPVIENLMLSSGTMTWPKSPKTISSGGKTISLPCRSASRVR